MSLVGILSHIFLDWCTTYGVWFLWPFSHMSFEGNIIGIIDLFFTLPLLAVVLWNTLAVKKKKLHHLFLRYV